MSIFEFDIIRNLGFTSYLFLTSNACAMNPSTLERNNVSEPTIDYIEAYRTKILEFIQDKQEETVDLRPLLRLIIREANYSEHEARINFSKAVTYLINSNLVNCKWNYEKLIVKKHRRKYAEDPIFIQKVEENDPLKKIKGKSKTEKKFLALQIIGYVLLATSWGAKNLYSEPYKDRAQEMQERINFHTQAIERTNWAEGLRDDVSWHKDSLNRSQIARAMVYETAAKIAMYNLMRVLKSEEHSLYFIPTFSDDASNEQVMLNNTMMLLDSAYKVDSLDLIRRQVLWVDSAYAYETKEGSNLIGWPSLNKYKRRSDAFNYYSLFSLIVGTILVARSKVYFWIKEAN